MRRSLIRKLCNALALGALSGGLGLHPASFSAEEDAGWRTSGFNGVEKILVTAIKPDAATYSLDRGLGSTSVEESQAAIKQAFGVSNSEIVHQYYGIPALTFWMQVSEFRSLESDERGNRRSGDQTFSDIVLSPDIAGGGDQPQRFDSGSGGLTDSRGIVGADDLHGLGFTGAGTRIAVIDTGIDLDNPDFTDRIISEACFCYNPTANCCPDGSDVQIGPGSAEDDHGHGTHVSGICAASGQRTGVAPEAEIVAVKTIDSQNSFYSFSDQTAALDWLYSQNLDLTAVNMSLGTFSSVAGDCDNSAAWTLAAYQAVENLGSQGTKVIVAAMNDYKVNELPVPACLSNTITVGATDDNDAAASFSNSSPNVNFFAPGVAIVSSSIGGSSATLSGTSMATPHVTGGIALLSHALNEEVTASNILGAMDSVSPVVTDSHGNSAPRINLLLAYQEMLEALNPLVPSLPIWLLYQATQ